MESFFQAAFSSFLEATGGTSRSSSSSNSRNGVGINPSRSNSTTGNPGRSGGNTWRMNLFGSRATFERAASSPAPSGGPSAARPSGTPEPAVANTAESRDKDRANPSNQEAKASSSTSSRTARAAPGGSSGSRSSSAHAEENGSRCGTAGDKAESSPVRDREAADRLKDLGNESFRRGMYGLAAEYYSKAIATDATVASYFTNRALCHKRENRYAEALQDADAALALEGMNVKGLYIKGDALVQLGDLDAGVILLEKAEKASSSGTARASHEILHSLLNAKKMRHERNQKQRSADRQDLEAFLKDCIAVAAQHRELSEKEVKSRLGQLELLVAEAEDGNAPFELPDFLTCRISMGLMDEPVVTPSGITYERKLLLEHFNRNGPTDPITREPCDRKNLIPNYAIKEASLWFLDRHPWAYDA